MAEVKVIGGGIIGVCSALALQADGHSVEIIERSDIGSGATFGNCGLLAVGEIVPISRPGMLHKIPKWLLDPQAPLFIRPRAIFSEMGWLARFLWASRPRRVREIAKALSTLTARAENDYQTLLERTGLVDSLVRAENIMVFNSPEGLQKDNLAWELRRELGFEYQRLSRADIRKLEPQLGGPINVGVLLRRWLHFSDPYLLTRRLSEAFCRKGGRIRIGKVRSILCRERRAEALVMESGEEVSADWIVLAAGAWSGSLSKQLGVQTPLAALNGYHMHVPNPEVKISRAVIYNDGGFVLTPMETGLRIAGTIEIAGLDPKPNFGRAETMARRAQSILPKLNLSGGTMWMGPRPFMPDTLPVLGLSPRQENVVLAYGHGQIGVTLGATTGSIVADLVAQRQSALDLRPFRSSRF